MWRIFQDNERIVVFRDELGHCYATSPIAGIRFSISHSLTLEQLNETTKQIKDSWANDFRAMTVEEINVLTWKGVLVVFFSLLYGCAYGKA